MEEILIPLTFFGMTFGITYVFFTTRNRERLALIEKGIDASLFNSNKPKFSTSKFILNIAVLLIGIGTGIFTGNYIHHVSGLDKDVAIPSMLFIFGGIGLLVGFFVTRRLESEE